MKLTKKTFIMIILSITILPLLGNETLNAYLHIGPIVTILNYLLPGLLCIFIIFDMFKQKKWPKLDLSLFTIITFWIILFVSFVFSITHQIFNFSNLFKFGCMTFILLMLKDMEFEEKQKKTLCYSLIGIASLVSIIGILQYFFQISLNISGIEKYIGALGRINSTTYIATLLDKYLALNIFLILYLMYKKYTNFYITSLALVLNVLALVFTFSRTGLLIYLILVFIFIILFIFKKQFINLILIVIITIGMYFIPGENFVVSSLANYINNVGTTISQKINLSFVKNVTNVLMSPFMIDINEYYGIDNDTTKPSTTEDTDEEVTLEEDIEDNNIVINSQLVNNVDYSLSSRSYYKSVAKAVMVEKWQHGVGIGSFTFLFNEQNVNDYLTDHNFTSYYRYPHSMYYQLGAETGIFGLVLFFLSIIYLLIKSSIKNKTFMPAILLLTILLMCYTETIFYMKEVAYTTIILIAIFSNKSFLKTE